MPRVIPRDKKAAPKAPVPKVDNREDKNTIREILQLLPAMISAVVKQTINGMPAPVVNIAPAKAPEVKVNSPVYVNPPDIKVPATVVNVPEGKAPVVNIEPPAVTLKTNRPNKWKFDIERDEYGRMTTIWAEAK